MLGVILEAIGAPAAALAFDASAGLVVARANTELGAVLGCEPRALDGELAEALLPRASVRKLASAGPSHPIDTRLGAWGLPYRAMARPLPADLLPAGGLLVVFLPQSSLGNVPRSNLGGLAPGDLGATALEILDLQSEMISRWLPNGTILYCNEAFARQCGRHLDDVIGANLFDLTPDAEVGQIRASVARLSPTCPSMGYDHYIPAGPDAEHWQEWIDRAFFDEFGRVVAYLSVGRDITERKLAERRLAESERRLKLALEAGRQGVWELDVESGVIKVDEALEELLRLPAGTYELDLDHSSQTYHPDDREMVRQAVAAVVAGESDAYRVEARRLTGDGEWAWVLNFGRVADRDASGRPLRMVGTTIDINQRKLAELHLRESEQRLRLALEAGDLGVWECDLAAERVRFDAICGTRLGWGPVECERTLPELLDLIHPRDRAKVRSAFTRCRRGEWAQSRIEYRLRRRDGTYVWLEEHAQVAERGRDGRPLQLVGVSADCTVRREAAAQLAHLALHDPLTGLPNRRGLAEALERAIARAQRSGLPLAILALDLDGFKAINDRYGHPAGDTALVEVAARLRRIIRRSDLVARLGGDEFAIIAGELRGSAPVLRLARRLGLALRAPIALQGAVAAIDVSIGVAFFPGDGQTTEELLARADMALYAAKREGVGYRFSSDLPAAVA